MECVEWAWAGYIIGGVKSEVTALCHLWLCVMAVLDKTNDGVEWQISARSVTDFHWTITDPIYSDRSRSRVSTRTGAFSIYCGSQ